jgi:hypothetical protein
MTADPMHGSASLCTSSGSSVSSGSGSNSAGCGRPIASKPRFR